MRVSVELCGLLAALTCFVGMNVRATVPTTSTSTSQTAIAFNETGGPTDATWRTLSVPATHGPQFNTAIAIDVLRDLQTSTSYSAYQSYLLLVPDLHPKLRDEVAGIAANHLGEGFEWPLFPSVTVNPRFFRLQMTSAFTSVERGGTVFEVDPSAQSEDFDPRNGTFITLSGNASSVPIPVALAYEASFIEGLTTRLVVDELTSLKEPLRVALNQPVVQPDPISSAIDCRSWSPPLVAQDLFAQRKTWLRPKGSKDGFVEVVHNVSSSFPLNAQGIVHGWCAADTLIGEPGGTQYKKDLWKLLRLRYTTTQLGELVGYTLTYLSGFELGVSMTQPPPGGAPQPSQPSQQVPNGQRTHDIVLAMSRVALADPAAKRVRSMAADTWQVLSEMQHLVHAFAAIDPQSLSIDQISDFDLFMMGYGQGCIRGVDDVYVDAFQLGYHFGFEQGYAKGFADGYNQAWNEARVVIARLQHEMDDKSDSLFSLAGKAFAGAFGTEAGKVIGQAVGTFVVAIVAG